ncbi:hypothetical protein SAMD00019534_024890 [Acytostelium subglobosum LB1]|uniref:hypothetical protein n=1 Tax=Acytostelium subglobosum LB1 TaxID=1410327 RepID=UPI000644D36C|nr:hypothetical protein SAMD00019534_024890 [Acytostelium subglobosum LB1]GAM19314.1 hypothetical protein SAMD00019534_024890 [Acytostelium subglobosum LB1]|eukprot:XP_012757241.1 hypothetical protein SAMD00019534_024890 [Acytostelium subglobosum LB1]
MFQQIQQQVSRCLVILAISLLVINDNIVIVMGNPLEDILLEKKGVMSGFNSSAGSLIAAIVVGTPVFFLVQYFLERYENREREQTELKSVQNKIIAKDKEKANNEFRSRVDAYGTAKILRECIDRSTLPQIYLPSPVSKHYSSSSLSLSTTTYTTTTMTPMPAPHNPYQVRTTSCTFSKLSTPTSSFCFEKRSPSNSARSSPMIVRRTSKPLFGNIGSPQVMSPPSPVLSVFGKSYKGSSPGISPVSSPTMIKRTLSTDKTVTILSPPRPKSSKLFQNAALLTLLSSNTVPKDHWHSIVSRILELAMTYWSPPKYDTHASLTALNQIELSLCGFSEQEKLNKQVQTIDDQKYFSPIIFEIYGKVLPLHEFIRVRPARIEKDITGVMGVYVIVLHSLFNSFSNWMHELASFDVRKANLDENKQILLQCLASESPSKEYMHQLSMNYLIDYIRNILFYSVRDYNGSSLYKIVDHYHGIADDIDKLLFEHEMLVDFEHMNSFGSNGSRGSQQIGMDGATSVDYHDIMITVSAPPEESTIIQVVENNMLRQAKSSNSLRFDLSTTGEAPDVIVIEEVNIMTIITSVTNRLSQIDFHLAELPQPRPEFPFSTMVTLEQQKTILSSCYNHLHTSLEIFAASDSFSAKFKIDTIPVLRMMLSTLNTLEEHVENGVSIADLPAGDLLEWTSTFTKIATSLNNLVLKNSSILLASQIVDLSLGVNSPTSPNFQSSRLARSSSSNSRQSRRSVGSPIGSPPGLISFLMANEQQQQLQLQQQQQQLLLHDQHQPQQQQQQQQGGYEDGDGVGVGSVPTLPPQRERCSQVVQLSQDSVMLTTMSTFALCTKGIPSGSLPPPLIKVSKYFADSVGVFLASIRTNIFCTYILLNPIYEMQQL